MTTWLARYQRFWDESHERLDDLLAALQAGEERDPCHARQRQRKETTMSKTQITAEPGIPHDHHHPRVRRAARAGIPCPHRAGTAGAVAGPRDLAMTIDRWEARDGGTWRYVHTDAHGNAYGFHGVFHGDPSPQAIVQTFEFEGAPGHVALQTAAFTGRGGITRRAPSRPSSPSRTATRWSPPAWNAAPATPATASTNCSPSSRPANLRPAQAPGALAGASGDETRRR